MKPNRLLLPCILFALPLACSVPPPDVVDSTPAPVVAEFPTLEKVGDSEVRLSNRSATTWAFHGYGPASPIYRTQALVDGEWTRFSVGWCGTGLEQQELAPGESLTFSFFRPEDDDREMRVVMSVVEVGTERRVELSSDGEVVGQLR